MPHTTSRYGNSDGSDYEESKDSSSRLDISSDAWISRQVLQLEGEGFAGLSALYILAELMRRVGKMEMNAQLFKTKAFSSASSPLFEPLRPLSEDDEQIEINSKVISKYRPCHYFDFISGSGLGGSCAVMLGVMRFTVDEAIRQTELLLTGVVPKFPRDVMSATTSRRAKNSSMLERYLRSSLEEIHKTVPEYQRDTADDATKDTDLFTMCADDYMCQTIVLTTHKERKGIQRPFVFRSYRIGPMSMSRNADDDTTKISLVDACRASLSAPSQFESVKISGLRGSFRDASVTIPNAAHETYHEVLDSSGSRIKFLLCLGLTSPATSTSRTNSPERMSPSNLDKSLATEAKENHFKYHRFADVNLPPSLAGDSQSKIQATKVSAQQYCQEEMNSKALDKWAKRLVKYRRIRAETTQWSDFAGLASRSPTSDLYRSDYFDVASKLNSGQLA